MRLYYFILSLFLLCSSVVKGQNKQLLYGFGEIPQSLLTNPGERTNYSWYSSVPLLGGISGYLGNSGATPSDLFGNDGIPYNDKFRDKVAYGMNFRDELSGNFQMNILDVGFRGKNKDNFYSLGLYMEMDGVGYYPQDIVTLMHEGNANFIGKRFDLSHIKARGEGLFVYHIGLNKKVSNRLSMGVRAKLYSSIFNFHSTKNKGYFLTNEGQTNLLRSTLDADVEIRTSGITELKDVLGDDTVDNGSGLTKILSKKALFGGNLGVGFDVGFSYNINERTNFMASLLDIGFVYHTKETQTFSLKGSATTEGLEIFLPNDPNNATDSWQNLVDELENLVPFTRVSENYITFRPTKLNVALRRDFGKLIGNNRDDCDCSIAPGGINAGRMYKNSYGGHLYMINRPRGPQTALTAFYQHRIGNLITLKSTYTVDKFSATNIGLGASINIGKVNMYLLADNLLSYQNVAASHYGSFQFGINIISWGRN